MEGVFDSLQKWSLVFWAGEALGFTAAFGFFFFFKYNNTVFVVVQLPSFLFFFVLIKIEFITLHSIPNPLAWVMAFSSRSFSFSLDEYSGSSSVLKQVCDVGSLHGSIDTRRDWTPSPETTRRRASDQLRSAQREFREHAIKDHVACLMAVLVPVRVGAVLDDHHVELLEPADGCPVCAGGELEEQPLLILPKWVNGFPEIPADQTHHMWSFSQSPLDVSHASFAQRASRRRWKGGRISENSR